MSEMPETDRPLAEAGRYPRLPAARERGLVVAALELPYWIKRERGERGSAEESAILHGQWWRTVTALTLHADASHLAANLATGLLFAAFVIPRLGAGFTWLAILLSGALGNALNAWGYRGESHDSIG